MSAPPRAVWTIGHSTRGIGEFVDLLRSNLIELVTDVRAFPGSRRYPHFAGSALEGSLRAAGIGYLHMPELGGRRRPAANSPNTAWRNDAFRGYADYMGTPEFVAALHRLE